MKHLFVIVLLILAVNLYAQDQVTPPKEYTPSIGLRLYNPDATPGADSLNQNMVDIDTAFKETKDKVVVLQVAVSLLSVVVIVLAYRAIKDKKS